MPNKVAILTLTRYPDIFCRLAGSIFKYEDVRRRVVVTSGEPLGWPIVQMEVDGWEQHHGIEPFVFARNVNLGLAAIGPDTDVLLINDDCELTMPVVETLQSICDADPSIGILSPQINGGVGNPDQAKGYRPPIAIYGEFDPIQDFTKPGPPIVYESRNPVCFVCIFIPASTLLSVGPLDEAFTGYGGDDVDYNERVKLAGLRCCITSRVSVRHGYGAGNDYSASFKRVMTPQQQQDSMKAMNRLAQDKHAGKVALIIPSSSVPRSLAFETSVAALLLPPGSQRLRIAGPSAAKNRNDGIRNASGDITHYLFLDDDHYVPQDTVLRLLAHRKLVVCALTCLASPPYLPVIAKGAELIDGVPHHRWYTWDDLKGQSGLLQVFAGPGSGVLVHRSVIERLEPPWFVMGHYQPEETSEDFRFYERIRALTEPSIPIFVDLDTRIGHIAPVSTTPEKTEAGEWIISHGWLTGMKVTVYPPPT